MKALHKKPNQADVFVFCCLILGYCRLALELPPVLLKEGS